MATTKGTLSKYGKVLGHEGGKVTLELKKGIFSDAYKKKRKAAPKKKSGTKKKVTRKKTTKKKTTRKKAAPKKKAAPRKTTKRKSTAKKKSSVQGTLF